MIIEFDEYKSKLNALKPALDGLGKALKRRNPGSTAWAARSSSTTRAPK